MEIDGFILIDAGEEREKEGRQYVSNDMLSGIDNFVEGLRSTLWPLNQFIHENPELAFEEYKAHDALTKFMRMQKGWQVTPSAYGMETAWVATFDSGRAGPVVSFNAEMGTLIRLHQ